MAKTITTECARALSRLVAAQTPARVSGPDLLGLQPGEAPLYLVCDGVAVVVTTPDQSVAATAARRLDAGRTCPERVPVWVCRLPTVAEVTAEVERARAESAAIEARQVSSGAYTPPSPDNRHARRRAAALGARS